MEALIFSAAFRGLNPRIVVLEGGLSDDGTLDNGDSDTQGRKPGACRCCELALFSFGSKDLVGGWLATTLLDVEGDKSHCWEFLSDRGDGLRRCGISPDESRFWTLLKPCKEMGVTIEVIRLSHGWEFKSLEGELVSGLSVDHQLFDKRFHRQALPTKGFRNGLESSEINTVALNMNSDADLALNMNSDADLSRCQCDTCQDSNRESIDDRQPLDRVLRKFLYEYLMLEDIPRTSFGVFQWIGSGLFAFGLEELSTVEAHTLVFVGIGSKGGDVYLMPNGVHQQRLGMVVSVVHMIFDAMEALNNGKVIVVLSFCVFCRWFDFNHGIGDVYPKLDFRCQIAHGHANLEKAIGNGHTVMIRFGMGSIEVEYNQALRVGKLKNDSTRVVTIADHQRVWGRVEILLPTASFEGLTFNGFRTGRMKGIAGKYELPADVSGQGIKSFSDYGKMTDMTHWNARENALTIGCIVSRNGSMKSVHVVLMGFAHLVVIGFTVSKKGGDAMVIRVINHITLGLASTPVGFATYNRTSVHMRLEQGGSSIRTYYLRYLLIDVLLIYLVVVVGWDHLGDSGNSREEGVPHRKWFRTGLMKGGTSCGPKLVMQCYGCVNRGCPVAT